MKIYFIFILLAAVACNYNNSENESIVSSDIRDIEIFNGTPNDHIPKKIKLADYHSIHKVVSELNLLRPVPQKNVRINFGEYEMTVNFKDGSYKPFFIIYTTYDGVIIQGSDGFAMTKYYKNDDLERAVLSLFMDAPSK